MISGWDLYKIYQPLKLHFTTDFNVMKYGFKNTATRNKHAETFSSRNYAGLFDAYAARLQSKRKAGLFCVANMVYDGDPNFIFKDYAQTEKTYLQMIKVRDSLTRTFRLDLDWVKGACENKGINPAKSIESLDGKKPPLLQFFLARKIQPETLSIIDDALTSVGVDFFDKWGQMYHNDSYVQKRLFTNKKFKPFFTYDKDKFHKLALEVFRSGQDV